MLVAIQEAIDVAFHVSADEGFGIPASYAESFDLLARNGVIDAALATRLARAASLRNRIAHGYAQIDFDRLWDELPDGLDTLERYATALMQYLQRATE